VEVSDSRAASLSKKADGPEAVPCGTPQTFRNHVDSLKSRREEKKSGTATPRKHCGENRPIGELPGPLVELEVNVKDAVEIIGLN